MASETRPGLAQAALALAWILDNPKAINLQPAAAKVLAYCWKSFARPRRAVAAAAWQWCGR